MFVAINLKKQETREEEGNLCQRIGTFCSLKTSNGLVQRGHRKVMFGNILVEYDQVYGKMCGVCKTYESTATNMKIILTLKLMATTMMMLHNPKHPTF